MVNSEFEEFTLPMGGTPYTFRFGLRELIELQERLVSGDQIPTIAEIHAGIQRGRLRYRRALIWSGLRAFHPDISEDAVTDLMAKAKRAEMNALLEAFGYSVTPDPRDLAELEPKANPPQAQDATTGANSTSALAVPA